MASEAEAILANAECWRRSRRARLLRHDHARITELAPRFLGEDSGRRRQ